MSFSTSTYVNKHRLSSILRILCICYNQNVNPLEHLVTFFICLAQVNIWLFRNLKYIDNLSLNMELQFFLNFTICKPTLFLSLNQETKFSQIFQLETDTVDEIVVPQISLPDVHHFYHTFCINQDFYFYIY